MSIIKKISLLLPALIFFYSCSLDEPITGPSEPVELVPGKDVVYLPVVVHVIHLGEPIGEGTNLSDDRIFRQIEILNEDFRRRENTRGHNNHPDGGDSMIEFVLAKQGPNGEHTNGINRIDHTEIPAPNLGYNQNNYAQYAYWDPSLYINIWTTPLPELAECLVLGMSTGPNADLPGIEFLAIPGPDDAEGIMINWTHFGESDISCHAKYGRTLTHEMGHYLGLLHPWGDKECETNDYCDDTPAVDKEVYGQNNILGCNGDSLMIGNYMNYTDDKVMNIFTKDQIWRMHYILKKHEERKSLITSKALIFP